MKLLAVKVKKSLGVPANPQARFVGTPKQYNEGDYAILTEDQFSLYGESDIELICEVKKPAKRKRKEKVKTQTEEGA